VGTLQLAVPELWDSEDEESVHQEVSQLWNKEPFALVVLEQRESHSRPAYLLEKQVLSKKCRLLTESLRYSDEHADRGQEVVNSNKIITNG
jgi:hypothetical protein